MVARPPSGKRIALLSYTPDHHLRGWMRGTRFMDDSNARAFERVPALPIKAEIEASNYGMLSDLIEAPLPLVSKRLREALVKSGAKNIDFYPAEILDQKTGKTIRDYWAFNITGKIGMVDAQKAGNSPFNGMLVFRLAESVNAILVHDRVQQSIEAAGIDTVAFLTFSEWGKV